MPKVILNRTDKKLDYFSFWLRGTMLKKGISQSSLAYELGVTQQGLSYKIKHSKFSLEELLKIFSLLQTDKEEVSELLLH